MVKITVGGRSSCVPPFLVTMKYSFSLPVHFDYILTHTIFLSYSKDEENISYSITFFSSVSNQTLMDNVSFYVLRVVRFLVLPSSP